MIAITVLATVFLNFFLPAGFSTRVSPGNPDTLLLSQVFIDSELFSEYTYTRENWISEEKTQYLYVKYNYNDKNQLISSVSCEDPSIASSNSRVLEAGKKRSEWVNLTNSVIIRQKNFEYDQEGTLVKLIEPHGYSTFKYDSRGRISTQLFYQDGRVNRYIDFQYDKKGNLHKASNYELDAAGKAQLATVYEYEYDNKENPFKSFRLTMMPGKYTNSNNITLEKYTLFLMDNQQQVTRYEYEYNAKGYPVRVNKNARYFYK